MGVIWTKRQQTKQPTSQKKSGDASWLWVPGYLTDAARNVPVTVDGTPITAANADGKGLRIDSTAKRVYSLSADKLIGANSFTLIWRFKQSSTVMNGGSMFKSDGTSGNSNRIDIYSLSSGAMRCDMYNSSGSPVLADSSTVLSVDGVFTIALVYNFSASTLQWYSNGVASGSSATPGTRTGAGTLLEFGGNVGGQPANQDYSLLAVLPFAANPVYLRSLHDNPWLLFAKELRPLPFDAAAGGSPYLMDAEAGSYSVTGVAATFKASRTLVAETGSYSLTGVAAGLSYGHSLTAEAGSYALTGVDATFKASRTLLADAGSYVVSGQDATFTYTPVGSGSPYSMDADAGSYTLTGVDASFKASRTLVAEAGSYALTGVDASFTRSEYRLVAETGSYVISGQEATFSTTGTVTPTGGRGGNGTGRNLSRKQKKKLKAVESQEWLKAEETARQLLNDRFTKQTPQEKAQALQTYVESLQPVIEALKALTTQIEEVKEVVEDAPVIELTPHQEILTRFDTLEKKLKSVEELVIILMADL